MFFFRFIFWLSPTLTKQNTHTHTRRRPRCFLIFLCCTSSSFSSSLRLLRLLLYKFCDFTYFHLPHDDTIGTNRINWNALLALSPIKIAFNLLPPEASCSCGLRQPTIRRDRRKCEPQRMRARVHPETRVTRIDIRFRLHECQKLFSTSSRNPDSCEKTNGRAEAGTTRGRKQTPKMNTRRIAPFETKRKLFQTESNTKKIQKW